MKLYYFNASKAIAERKAIVVSERRFEPFRKNLLMDGLIYGYVLKQKIL